MISFPALAPTSRRVIQGAYPVKRFSSMAGTGTSRIYGSQPFDSKMDLEFSNRLDRDVLKIVEAHESSRGAYDVLELPDEIWSGMEDALRVRLQRDYSWRFDGEPQVTSGSPGVSSVSVSLGGKRDG